MTDRRSPLLLDRIGKNEFVETWLAQWRGKPQKLLVKLPSAQSGVELLEANRLLEQVYGRTRDFRHRNIFPPRHSAQLDERLLLIRHYLQDASTLSPETFREHRARILLQIFSAVDFIHALGLVHTDLQSTNMLVLQRNGVPRLLVTDLDFIKPTASQATKTVTGAPGYIAPEVYREQVLLPQSDFYSLGVMLRNLILGEDDNLSKKTVGTASAGIGFDTVPKLDLKSIAPQSRRLAVLINRLIEPRYQDRPEWLGQLVEEYAEDYGWDFEAYKRELLWSLVETAVSRASRNGVRNRLGLSEIVAGEIDAFGLNHEFFGDIGRTWSGNRIQLNRLYHQIFHRAEIERHGYSWRVSLSDEQIIDIYARHRLSSVVAEAMSPAVEPIKLIKSALRLKSRGQFYKSYLVFKRLLDADTISALPRSLQAAVLGKLGYVCLAIGQSEKGREYFEEAVNYDRIHPRKAVRLITEISSLFNQGRNQGEASEYGWRAVRIARQSSDVRLRLDALRMLLWTRYMIRGGDSVAWKTKRLLDYAEKNGYSGAAKRLANNWAAVLWSLGQYSAETEFLEVFLEKKSFLPTEEILISLYTNLGQAYGDQSQFGKAIGAFKRAQALSSRDTNWGRQAYAHHGLIAAYIASSKFKKAQSEAELLYEKSTRWADRSAKTVYHISIGQILLARGQMKDALRNLRLGAEMARVNGFDFHRVNALLQLTRAHRWRGDLEALRRDQDTMTDVAGQSVDWRARIHIKLSKLWLQAQVDKKLDVNAVTELIADAAARGRTLEYAEGLFLLAEFGHDREAFRQRSINDEIWKICRKKRAPRYAGLYFLIRSLSGKARREPKYRINQLKQAVDRLRKAEARYHAVQAALRLIRDYRELGELPRAQNVLVLARSLVEPLMNPILQSRLDAEAEIIREMIGPESTNIDLLREVGETLTTLHNYRRTLEMLLKNAVNLSGAERGAIVLTHSDLKGLRIEVSHACDEVSERDILTISRNSITRTLEDETGLIVDDAQRDKLTKGFRSVMMHNIVSIACVPLKSRGRLLGALYLDHRSIPGLFSESNYQVIEALARFMAIAIEIARGVKRSDAERAHAAERLESLGETAGFLAVDEKSKGVLNQIPKVAVFDTNVLLCGESGTGKGLLAEAIHNQSRRADGPFIALNCSHIRGENGLGELFGVAVNAFTGVGAREGRVERADGGTLFLDEIGELPLEMQATLLDVLENKKITRRGGTKQIAVDFRLICATNADLEDLSDRGKFRKDLFFRISAFVLKVPPLRERPEDIEPLGKHLISILPGGGSNLVTTRRFMDALRAYQWPGNVRELRNEIERVLILRESNRLGVDLLKPEITHCLDELEAVPLGDHLLQVERERIEDALRRAKGNVTAAGKILVLAPSTLRSKLSKLNIDPGDFKA